MARDILTDYYSRRAPEYERIYHRDDPVRQREQHAMADEIGRSLKGRRVLEIACGTGYWTQFVAENAAHITAIDSSPEMLALARAKNLPFDRAKFCEANAYDLNSVPGEFDGCLAMFWLSHVPRSRLAGFLKQLHERLLRNAIVLMADNVFMPGVGGELVQPENSADTFKVRTLSDGSAERVLKNYFSESELRRMFALQTADLQITIGQCFWRLSYHMESPPV